MPIKPTNNEEEIIYGRNAVLSFLETAMPASPGDSSQPMTVGLEISDALAKLKLQVDEEALTAQDLAELSKLAHMSGASVNKILVAEGTRPDERIDRIWQLARSLKVPVQKVDRQRLEQILPRDAHHQGVLAYVSAAELWSIETFLLKFKLDSTLRARQGMSMDGYTVAILDGVEDPHNLGAVIRSAESFGLKALIIPQRRSAQLTGTVAKVSAGALANLPVVRVTNLVQTIETLKEHGFWIVGTAVDAEQTLWQCDLKRQVAVIVGGEGAGMARLTREHCDFLVKIPMLGKTESLNASVAAGIFFYEAVRQNSSTS